MQREGRQLIGTSCSSGLAARVCTGVGQLVWCFPRCSTGRGDSELLLWFIEPTHNDTLTVHRLKQIIKKEFAPFTDIVELVSYCGGTPILGRSMASMSVHYNCSQAKLSFKLFTLGHTQMPSTQSILEHFVAVPVASRIIIYISNK